MCGPGRSHHRSLRGNRLRNKSSTQIENYDNHPQEYDPNVKKGLIVCVNCRSTYKFEKSEFCPYCGVRIIRCSITKSVFKVGDEFSQCPNCLSVFHFDHLQDWFRINSNCPVCRETLKETYRGKAGIHTIIN